MSFRDYLDSLSEKSVIFTFGRFNPVTKGHAKNILYMEEYAKRHKIDDKIIYTTSVHNNKKNPLPFHEKLSLLERLTENTTIKVNETPETSPKTIIDSLIEQGYKRIVLVAGSDRLGDYKALYEYVNSIDPTIYFKIIESGKRDRKISGTKMREYVKENSKQLFENLLPDILKDESERLFGLIKENLKG